MEEENIEFINTDKDSMALVATVVYDGVPLLYEWLSKEKAYSKLRQVMNKEHEGDNSGL